MARTLALMLAAGSAAMMPLAGCENLPGDEKTQGAVIGGVGGAVAGAAVGGEDNRLLGALLGGALGAGGGYLIGAQIEKAEDGDREGAVEAVQEAQRDPATAAEAREATTADINNDGFVTLDEVVALEQAGFSNQEIIQRLRATNQIFELNAEQEQYLLSRGVDRPVIVAMQEINRAERERILAAPQDNVIGRPRP